MFTERQQYEWLLDTLLELQRVHPVEDELMQQYFIIGICKASAVIGVVSIQLQISFHNIWLYLPGTHHI